MTSYFFRLIDQVGKDVKHTEKSLSASSNSLGYSSEIKLSDRLRIDTFLPPLGEGNPNEYTFKDDNVENGMEEKATLARDKELSDNNIESNSKTKNITSASSSLSNVTNKDSGMEEKATLARDKELSDNNIESNSKTKNITSSSNVTIKKPKINDLGKTNIGEFDQTTDHFEFRNKTDNWNMTDNDKKEDENRQEDKINSFNYNNKKQEEYVERKILGLNSDDAQEYDNQHRITSQSKSITNNDEPSIPIDEFNENLRFQLSKIREWMTESKSPPLGSTNPKDDKILAESSPSTDDHNANAKKVSTYEKSIDFSNFLDQNQPEYPLEKEQGVNEQHPDKIQDYSISIGKICIVIEGTPKEIFNNNKSTKNERQFLSSNNNSSDVSRLSRHYLRFG